MLGRGEVHVAEAAGRLRAEPRRDDRRLLTAQIARLIDGMSVAIEHDDVVDAGIVALSIDRSGSMAMSTDEKITKLDLAKEAAHLVVDLLDERNEVGIQSWDTEFIWDSTIKPARDKAAIHHAIATIKAGGARTP